jgi:NitT/TauT family transport system ATP-binding protein
LLDRLTRSNEIGDIVALEVSGLRKSYNRAGVLTTALENVSFSVPDRQFISIVGPSGCGKSTLLRCIAGLAEPSGGDIRVGGRAMHGVPDDMVYVFQEYNRSLFPWRRLLGNVAYPIESGLPRSVSSDRARSYIKLVGLERPGSQRKTSENGMPGSGTGVVLSEATWR